MGSGLGVGSGDYECDSGTRVLGQVSGCLSGKSFLHLPEKCCLSYRVFIVDSLDISKEMSKNVCIHAHMHTPKHIYSNGINTYVLAVYMYVGRGSCMIRLPALPV